MIALSALDQQRFGFAVARDDALGRVDEALAFCRANQVRLLIARCRSEDLGVAHALEAAGGRLMDTLVWYARRLAEAELPANECPLAIRPYRPGDEDGVQQVAEQAFQGYLGHYHADPRLDPARVAEVYPSWALRSCQSREVAGQVLIADDGAVAGFATLRMNAASEGEGVLFAVAPRAQGRGVYRAFMLEGMRWCRASGATRMVVSTQLTHVAVQRVWVRLGFELERSSHTYHLWLDEG